MWSRMKDCIRGSSVRGSPVAGTGNKYNPTACRASQKLGTWNDGTSNIGELADAAYW